MHLSRINHANIDNYNKKLVSLGLTPATIKRRLSSVRRFCTWAAKEGYIDSNPFESPSPRERANAFFWGGKIKKPFSLFSHLPIPLPFRSLGVGGLNSSNKLRTNNQQLLTSLLPLLVLLTLSALLGIGAYRQFFSQALPSGAYPLTATPPNRVLSFQGRLTDTSGNPINAPTNFTFKLWNDDLDATEAACNGGGDENCLWSGSCTLNPDTDGIFSTLLGSDCGAEITQDVFSENTEVWLGVTVADDDEAEPRIQIATVAYALNAETLQGLPPGTGLGNILFIDENANIGIGVTSPTLDASLSSGTFGIRGPAISITTVNDGNLTLAPDGSGVLNVNLSGAGVGSTSSQFRVTDANITTGNLVSVYAGTDAAGFDLLSLSSGSTETEVFTVDEAGNTNIAGNLDIGGTATFSQLTTDGPIYTSSGVLNSEQYLDENRGGTGLGGYTTGDLLYASGENTLAARGIGATGQVLTVSGGVPQWVDLSVTGGVSGSGTQYYLPRWASGSTLENGNIYDNGTFVGIGRTPATNPTLWVGANGNVGVGTTNPSSLLTVQGKIIAGDGSNNYEGIEFGPNDGSIGYLGTGDIFKRGLYINSVDNRGVHIMLSNSSSDFTIQDGDGAVKLMFDSSSGYFGIGTTTPVGRLHITGSGNVLLNTTGKVGIGVTSPSSRLSVAGGVGIGTTSPNSLYHQTAVAPDGGLIIEGNVGIGTTSPEAKLEVVGNTLLSPSAGTYALVSTPTNTGLHLDPGYSSKIEMMNYILLYADSITGVSPGADNSYPLGTDSRRWKSLSIGTDGANIGGNVGIGTTAPTSKLHVIGECVAKGTLIKRRRRRKDGTWEEEDVPVEDILPNDEVLSLNDKTGRFEWHQVEKTMDKGHQTVFALTTASGKRILTTANHPYLTIAKPEIDYGTYEVDLSVRFDKFTQPTVVGLAWGKDSFAVKINPADKKKVYRLYQQNNRPELFQPQTYARSVVLALKLWQRFPSRLIIDEEYPGHEKTIREIIRAAFPKTEVLFGRIGKGIAHEAAYQTYKGKRKADAILEFDTKEATKNGQGLKALRVPPPRTGYRGSEHPHGQLPKSYYKTHDLSIARWTKIAQIKTGQYVATLDGWEEITGIQKIKELQTYDLQIEGTHNFVGNGIVAHNTTISSNLSVGGTATFSQYSEGPAYLSSGVLNTETYLDETRGGTGLGSYTEGDLLYASGANTLAARGIGSTGQVLTVSGGVPQWVDLSVTGGVSGIGGSGTENYLPKFTAGTTLGNSQIYDNGAFIGIGGTTSATEPRLYVAANTNFVGIGTSTPTNGETALEVGNGSLVVHGDGSFTGQKLNVGMADNPGILNIYDDDGNIATLISSGLSYFIGGSDHGNVGIGTTNPSYKLEVVGAGYFSGNLGLGGTFTLGTLPAVSDNDLVLTSDSGVVKSIDTSSWDKDGGDDYLEWLLAGDQGTPQSIGSDNTALILGDGVGIGTSATNTDTLTVYHLDTSTQASSNNSTATFIQDITLDTFGHLTGLATGALTASNGLTLATADFKLGGSLSELTKIDLASNNFGFYGTGNVGVGTTSPTNLLAISTPSGNDKGISIYNSGTGATDTAAIKLENASFYSTLFISTANHATLPSATGFYTSASNGFVVFPNAKKALRVKDTASYFYGDGDTGNVGIGTNNPLNNLHVYHTNSGGGITIDRSSSAIWSGLALKDAGTEKWFIGQNDSDNYLRFRRTGSSDDLIIDTAGKVGIGTTSPAYQLEVAGSLGIGTTATIPSLNLTGVLLDGSGSAGTSGQVLSSIGVGTSWIDANGVSGSGTQYYLPRWASGSTLENGNIYDNGTFVGIGKTPATNPSLWVGGNGNVGIGTSSPDYKLHVVGDGLFENSNLNIFRDDGQDLYIYYSAGLSGIPWTVGVQDSKNGAFIIAQSSDLSSNQIFIIDDNRRVGIGTTNPLYPLDIHAHEGNNLLKLASFDENSTSGLLLTNDAVNWQLSLRGTVSDSLVFRSGDSDLATFTTGGNVGIGTTSPTTLLNVEGNIANNMLISLKNKSASGFSGIDFYDSSGTNKGGIGYANSSSPTLSTRFFAGSLQYQDFSLIAGAAERVTIAYDTGAVGINNLYPAAMLDVNGSAWLRGSGTSGLAVNPTGNVGIGTTAPSDTLDVAGTARVRTLNSGSYNANLNVTSTGVLTTNTSDAFFKTNVTTIDNALSKITRLRGVTFNWKDQTNPRRMTGLIAQEVINIMPELVFQNPTDGYLGINYGEAAGLLIEGIKEQQNQITGLQNNLDDLDSDLYLTDIGNLSITSTETGDQTIYEIKNDSGTVIDRIGAFSNALVAELTAGIVRSRELFAARRIVSPLVETGQLISPIVETDEVRIKNQELSIKNNNGEEVANFNANGESGFGRLIADQGTFGNLLANEVQINSLSAQSLTTNHASASELVTTGLLADEATVSGTLYAGKIVADEIVGLESRFGDLLAANIDTGQISGLEDRLAELEAAQTSRVTTGDNQIGPSPTPIPPTLSAELTGEPSPTPALTPNGFPYPEADPTDTELDPETKELVNQILASSADTGTQADMSGLTADDLTIKNTLTVLGATSLADTTVSGSLNIGGTLSLADNSINSLTGTLYLQNLGMGGIDILAGKITIDPQGNLFIQNNLTVAGTTTTTDLTVAEEATVSGSLFAQILHPVDQDITVVLDSQLDSDTGEFRNSKFEIRNSDGNEVAAVDSSGHGSFRKLLIADAADPVVPLSATEVTTNATAGKATLAGGQTELVIRSAAVTDQTLIYITPTSTTQNQVLYLAAKKAAEYINKGLSTEALAKEGWFKVAVDTPINQNIDFNWWIIN